MDLVFKKKQQILRIFEPFVKYKIKSGTGSMMQQFYIYSLQFKAYYRTSLLRIIYG